MAHDERWAPAWITQSNPIYQGPVEILAIMATPKADKRTTVTLRHGLDSGDPVAGIIQADTGASLPLLFGAPVLFDRGLYVAVDGDIVGVLLIWRPYIPPDR